MTDKNTKSDKIEEVVKSIDCILSAADALCCGRDFITEQCRQVIRDAIDLERESVLDEVEKRMIEFICGNCKNPDKDNLPCHWDCRGYKELKQKLSEMRRKI